MSVPTGLIRRGRRHRWQFRLRTFALLIAVVAVLLAASVRVREEVPYYREWAEAARSERTYLEVASSWAAEAEDFRKKAAAGAPFTPRRGFMPYGPLPIGESPPKSWDKEARFSASQAANCRYWAAPFGRKRREIERRWRWHW